MLFINVYLLPTEPLQVDRVKVTYSSVHDIVSLISTGRFIDPFQFWQDAKVNRGKELGKQIKA